MATALTTSQICIFYIEELKSCTPCTSIFHFCTFRFHSLNDVKLPVRSKKVARDFLANHQAKQWHSRNRLRQTFEKCFIRERTQLLRGQQRGSRFEMQVHIICDIK